MLSKTGGKVGVVACDDILAIEIQHLCDICEIEQSELALLGFNNSLLAKTAQPALTSVEIFPRFLGSEAAALAINTKGNDKLKLETDHIVVPHKIVERASTKI
ncbi:MAG TPA: LacI family transcriptional regulator, partial [Lactobacillus sp.]|nr:LacI family transcriptional regulator [Lactobacillus sp.]